MLYASDCFFESTHKQSSFCLHTEKSDAENAEEEPTAWGQTSLLFLPLKVKSFEKKKHFFSVCWQKIDFNPCQACSR